MASRSLSLRVVLLLIALALGIGAAWLVRRGASRSGGPLVGPERALRLLDRPIEVLQGEVRVDRLQIALSKGELEALSGHGDPLVEREAPLRLLSEDRDLWFAAHDSAFSVELPEDVTGVLLVGAGVHRVPRTDPVPLPKGIESAYRILLDHEGATQPTVIADFVHPLEVDDPRVWRPLAKRISTMGLARPRLVFQARFQPPEPPRESPISPDPLTTEFLETTGFVWTNPVLALTPTKRPDPPSVILLSIDTLRADHMSAWGYERPTTPNLDRLAALGARFEDARTTAPWTLPSYGSLLTGRLPTEHRAGVKRLRDGLWEKASNGQPLPEDLETPANAIEVLASELVTLAEALRDQGYRTAAFVNNPYLHAARGVDQGFERYVWYSERAEHGVDLALDWLDRQEGLPSFLFLHLMDPHMPYAAPDPWERRYQPETLAALAEAGLPWLLGNVRQIGERAIRWRQTLVDLYDAEIAYTDAQVGRFLDGLDERGLTENTILVLHADHGEEFWEHGGFEHGHTLNAELVHVPLAVVWPARIPAGVRVGARVRTTDVLPTVLELLDLAPSVCGLERGFEGEAAGLRPTSLLAWIDGARTDDLPSLSEALLYGPPNSLWQEAKSLSDGRWKIIVGGPDPTTDLLYDLALDPREEHDVRAAHEDVALRLRALLEASVRQARAAARTSEPRPVPKSVIDQMRALGYAADGAEPPPDDAPKTPDPEPHAPQPPR